MEANNIDIKPDDRGTKNSKVDSIRSTIHKALDEGDTEFAMELIDYWDSAFPMEKEGRTIFLYTKLQAFIRCYELAEGHNSKTAFLRSAIETGNNFFAANEAEGFPMDSDVQRMWYTLLDLSAAYASSYPNEMDEGYEDEEEDCYHEFENYDIFDEEWEDESTDTISASIGRVNFPKYKPKPPREYDDSLTGKLLKAVDRHLERHEDLDGDAYNLLEYICEELGINYDDFYNSICEYWNI